MRALGVFVLWLFHNCAIFHLVEYIIIIDYEIRCQFGLNIRNFLLLMMILFETVTNILLGIYRLRVLRNIKAQTFVFLDLFFLLEGIVHLILRLLVHEIEGILYVE